MIEVDALATIYCAMSDQGMRNAAIEIRNPAKGIHIQHTGRDTLGNHRVRIIAPNKAVFNEVKEQFYKLDSE